MSWETGISTIRSSPYSIFSVKVMCSELLKLVSLAAGPFLARSQPSLSPGPISKLFSITQPSMSTGNLDWKGEDHRWAREDRRGGGGGD